jgi:hypothetical protein
MPRRSPRILTLSWGSITVENFGEFKDCRTWPGGAGEWNWNETGTRHSPGIQPADVEPLLSFGATVIVLSRGMEERLGVAEETLTYLAERDIEVHVADTEMAVELYNSLTGIAAVGGLFHSTC